MPRHFNTAGPCDPEIHYVLAPERRLPGARALVEQRAYFTLDAPRTTGKTTALAALAASLTREGRYAAMVASVELGAPFGDDVGAAESAILGSWRAAADDDLAPELRPPPWPDAPAGQRIHAALHAWAAACPRPLVLLVDDAESLHDRVLLSVLWQLRDGYRLRPAGFPWSVAVAGLRETREGGAGAAACAAAFGVSTRAVTLRDFTVEEVAALYAQHALETGQCFEPDAVARAFELSRGHAWLVNALAHEALRERPGDPRRPVVASDIDRACTALVERDDARITCVTDRLGDPRVRAVLEPMITGDALPTLPPDHLRAAVDLGLVRAQRDGGLELANAVFRDAAVRALTGAMRASIPRLTPAWLDARGVIDWERLREALVAFWMQRADALFEASPYHDAAPHLALMAFLSRVVLGAGRVDYELAIGSKRLDLCVEHGGDRLAIEARVLRDADKVKDPIASGLMQLGEYLQRLDVAQGWLVIFDRRRRQSPLSERVRVESTTTPGGRQVTVMRL